MATSLSRPVSRPRRWANAYRVFGTGYHESVFQRFAGSWERYQSYIENRVLVRPEHLDDIRNKYLTMSRLAADWQVWFDRSTLMLRIVQLAGSVLGTFALLIASLLSGQPYLVLSFLVAAFVLALLAMTGRRAHTVVVVIEAAGAGAITVQSWRWAHLPLRAVLHLPDALRPVGAARAAAVGVAFAGVLVTGLLVMLLVEIGFHGALLLRQAPDVGAFTAIHRVLHLLDPDAQPPQLSAPVRRREMASRMATAARAISRMHRIYADCGLLFRETAKHLRGRRAILIMGTRDGDEKVQDDLLRYLIALCQAYYGDLPRPEPVVAAEPAGRRWDSAVRQTVAGLVPLVLLALALRFGLPADSGAGEALIVGCVVVALLIFLRLLHVDMKTLTRDLKAAGGTVRSILRRREAEDPGGPADD